MFVPVAHLAVLPVGTDPLGSNLAHQDQPPGFEEAPSAGAMRTPVKAGSRLASSRVRLPKVPEGGSWKAKPSGARV